MATAIDNIDRPVAHTINVIDTAHDTSLLKFLRRSRQRKNNIQKKCYPQQTYGVGSESPTHFRNSFTLVNPQGYQYKERYPDIDYQLFKPDSVGNAAQVDAPVDFDKQFQTTLDKAPLVFHKKKGLLSEYMDKNGWMTQVHILMGDERTKIARAANNRDRNQRVKSLKHPPNSVEFQVSPILQKPVDRHYFETIPVLMGEKLRIRKKRNRLESDSKERHKQEKEKGADKFQIFSFQRRQLSSEMDQRAQTSRTMTTTRRLSEYNATARTGFTKLSEMRSTRAGTTRLSHRAMDLQGYRDQDEEYDSDSSEIVRDKFYKTQKIIR